MPDNRENTKNALMGIWQREQYLQITNTIARKRMSSDNLWANPDDIEPKKPMLYLSIGIPDSDREKVFEMFRQLSQPVESIASGTGLGLTFSKGIVEMHGGRIWLESTEGKGTAFTFTLPIAEPQFDCSH